MKNLSTFENSPVYVTNENKVELLLWHRGKNAVRFVPKRIILEGTEILNAPQIFLQRLIQAVILVTFRKTHESNVFTMSEIEAVVDDSKLKQELGYDLYEYHGWTSKPNQTINDICDAVKRIFPANETINM